MEQCKDCEYRTCGNDAVLALVCHSLEVSRLEAENKDLRDKLYGECVDYVAELEAELKAKDELLTACWRECSTCYDSEKSFVCYLLDKHKKELGQEGKK